MVCKKKREKVTLTGKVMTWNNENTKRAMFFLGFCPIVLWMLLLLFSLDVSLIGGVFPTPRLIRFKTHIAVNHMDILIRIGVLKLKTRLRSVLNGLQNVDRNPKKTVGSNFILRVNFHLLPVKLLIVILDYKRARYDQRWIKNTRFIQAK